MGSDASAANLVLALSLCVTAAFLPRLCLLPWWDSGAVELSHLSDSSGNGAGQTQPGST